MNGKLMIASLFFLAAALAATGDPAVELAGGSQCASQCYAAEQACMQAKKGHPSCSAELVRCLQSCR